MRKYFLLAFIVGLISTISFGKSVYLKNLTLSDKVTLQSQPEYTEDAAWTIDAVPYYEELTVEELQTNSWNQIYHWFTYSYTLGSYRLFKQQLDPYNSSGSSELTFTYVPITTNGITCQISGDRIIPDREGSITLFANDGVKTVNRILAFNNYSLGNQVNYYVGDVNEFTNDIYDEWYGYIANRSSISNIINSGYNACQATIRDNDYIWANKQITYAMGKAYSSNLYIPLSAVSFRMLSAGNAIRNSGNAIGSKVSINCAHYNDLKYEANVTCNYTHKWMKPDGTQGTVHASKAAYLPAWAEEKGIYDDVEIRALNDALAYVYDTEVPVECQASILKLSLNDEAPNHVTNCYGIARAPGFTISQHGTLVPQYISLSFTSTGLSSTAYRKDGIGDVIPDYHYAHVCDSGRPMFWVHNGNAILNSTYHFAAGGPSFAGGWRIIRDFCKEHGSTLNLYDPVTKTKTVINP